MNALNKIVATVLALTFATSAMAHDPKLHAQKDQMNCEKMAKHIELMKNMDHSQMDMNDPAMKSMMSNMEKMKKIYAKHCVSSTDSK